MQVEFNSRGLIIVNSVALFCFVSLATEVKGEGRGGEWERERRVQLSERSVGNVL